MLILAATGAGILFIVFTTVWLVQLRTKNAAIVDPVWSLSFPLLAIVYFCFSQFTISQAVFLGMVIVWGLRLGIHLLVRVLKEEHEDVRYAALRREWGSRQNVFMLRFYYYQAILALILSIPFALVMTAGHEGFSVFEIGGVAIWAIAVCGESIADAQLKSFKADPENRGKVCEKGLWYYSRHPNYFFEWLIWVSFFAFALGSPLGAVSIICPLLMLYFLLKVTGIPYTEIQSVRSKGQAYIEYQRTTSAFVPLPKKLIVKN
jgi:steroid 5-alpha reductase family enzyme